MHVSTSHSIESKRVTVSEVNVPTQPEWNYVISLGFGTNIYLSRSELVALTNQSIRLIADAWATEAENAE